jgi:hypothetical protein
MIYQINFSLFCEAKKELQLNELLKNNYYEK